MDIDEAVGSPQGRDKRSGMATYMQSVHDRHTQAPGTLWIPRTIHRIWIEGSPELPEASARYGERWRELNPRWKVREWSESGFKMENARLYDFPMSHGDDILRYRADLLRLEILLRYGGVYVDMDVEPLRPIEDLLKGHTAVAAYSPNLWKGNRVLSNAFIAATPHHPWIRRCVENMEASCRQYAGHFLAMATGPHHINRCLRGEDPVTILDTSLIYPTFASEMKEAYMFHAWSSRAKLKRNMLP